MSAPSDYVAVIYQVFALVLVLSFMASISKQGNR